ncbi:cysteine hydrolase family protein [Halorhabdus amylolytica]|uniref:cysteine hydrolase family protein n=1 Tax=Halorhabdus amylolytica TaxID=2559573 RepID=UPI0010AA4CD5|nr:cysteine hydrolase [Halorhabdus amylolytica]
MDTYTRPDPEQAALLTIDTQNDFTLPDASARIAGTAAVVPQMKCLVEAFRSEARPVIHVVRLYRDDGSNVDQCRRQAVEDGAEIVRPGTEGAELVAELKPSGGVSLDATQLLAGAFQKIDSNEWIRYKPRWGAFYSTGLDDFLGTLSVNTVVICGCNFPNCPRTTVYEASERDYRIVFVPDATSKTYNRGLDELENIGVALMDTEETIDWITG